MQRGKASNSSSEACFVSVPKSKPGITMQKPRNMNAKCHGQISTNPVIQYAKEMPHRDSGASASGATRGVLPHCSPSRPLCPGSPWAPPSARAFSPFPKQGRCLQALTPSPGPRSLWPSPGGEGVTRLTFTSYLLPQTVYQSVPQNKNRRTSGDRPKIIFPNYKYERGNRGSKASRDPPKARESYCLPPVN